MLIVLAVWLTLSERRTKEKEAAVDEGLLREAREQIEPITWEKDGAEMVLIPAGSFEMGDH